MRDKRTPKDVCGEASQYVAVVVVVVVVGLGILCGQGIKKSKENCRNLVGKARTRLE